MLYVASTQEANKFFVMAATPTRYYEFIGGPPRCLICTGTGLAPATSAPGLGSPTSAPGPGSPLPHLRRDWALRFRSSAEGGPSSPLCRRDQGRRRRELRLARHAVCGVHGEPIFQGGAAGTAADSNASPTAGGLSLLPQTGVATYCCNRCRAAKGTRSCTSSRSFTAARRTLCGSRARASSPARSPSGRRRVHPFVTPSVCARGSACVRAQCACV
jgi:hypothetical protein